MVFAQVAPVFITENTPFRRHSVAQNVCQIPAVQPELDEKCLPTHGDHKGSEEDS